MDTNVLDWFRKTLDEVIQLTTKVNKTTTSSWVTVHGSDNTVGKQGADRSSTTSPTNTNTQTQAHYPEEFFTKTSDFTGSEVSALLQMYSCLIYKKNNHPLWQCHVMKSTYYGIRLKNAVTQTSSTR